MNPPPTLYYIVAASLLIGIPESLAQPREPSDAAIDRAVERILQKPETEREEADLEELWHLRENPIDLLSATPFDLAALPGISLQDAINITTTVTALQPTSFSGLADSSTIPIEQISLLRAFTRLGVPDQRGPTGSVRVRLSRGLQAARGGRDTLWRVLSRLDPITASLQRDTVSIGSPFRGAPHGVLARVMMEQGDFSGGITLETDRYEPLFVRDTSFYTYRQMEEVDADSIPLTRVPSGYTGFASLHAAYQHRWARIVAGDFTVGFGQGLAFGGARGPSMSATLTDGPTSPPQGLKPYRSSGESGFQRGLGLELTLERVLGSTAKLTLFGSWNSLDATLETITAGPDSGRSLVRSIRDNGLRRTFSELRSANARERIIGAALTIARNGWRVGAASGIGTVHPEEADGLEQHWEVFSIHAQQGDRRRSMYAEIATSNRSVAGIIGFSTRAGGSELAACAGWWPASFESPQAVPLPVGGMAPGRSALMFALRHPFRHGDLAVQADIGRRSVRSVTTPFPHWASSGQLRAEYHPATEFAANLRLIVSTTLDGTRIDDAIGRDWGIGVEQSSISMRCGFEYEPGPIPLIVRARVERRVLTYESRLPPATGWLAHILVRGEPAARLTLSASLALHGITSADARLAVAFSDLPGRTLSRALYGSGRSLTVAAKYHLTDDVAIALSYTEDRRTDVNTMRSGLDALAGPLASTLNVQIDVRIGGGRRPSRDRD